MRDGHTIYVRDIGKGEPVVLLHGFGMQSAHWLPFALPLARRSRFIIPDLRGFGRSHLTPFNQACVISNYADDLADLLDHFRLSKFKLAGISMGALTALQYQELYGHQNIARYLHIDQAPKCINGENWPWGLFGGENKTRLQRASQFLLDVEPYIETKTAFINLPIDLRQQMWQELGDFFAAALSRQTHKSLIKKMSTKESLMMQLLPTQNWPVYVHCIKAYLEQDYDMLKTFQDLTIPVSLMVGLKSEMYPCGGQLRIADHAKNCEIIPFPNSGHTPLIDQPLKFLKELKRFALS